MSAYARSAGNTRQATAPGWRLLETLPLVCHPFNAAEASAEFSDGLPSTESSSLLGTGKESRDAVARKGTIIKALLYAVQVFYSFFIM